MTAPKKTISDSKPLDWNTLEQHEKAFYFKPPPSLPSKEKFDRLVQHLMKIEEENKKK